jgi:hypothetical protein
MVPVVEQGIRAKERIFQVSIQLLADKLGEQLCFALRQSLIASDLIQ